MLRLGLCDYSDAYVLVRGTITVPNTGIAAALNNTNKKGIYVNTIQMKDLYAIMALSLMFLMILIVLHLNINKK